MTDGINKKAAQRERGLRKAISEIRGSVAGVRDSVSPAGEHHPLGAGARIVFWNHRVHNK